MNFADLVLTNGNVITVDPSKPAASAVAVIDGHITAVGSDDDVAALCGPDTEVVDLQGQTLIPGILDAHSHLAHAATSVNFANLTAPPVGTAESIADIIELLRVHVAKLEIKPGDPIIGYGYFSDALSDGREMTRHDLDEAFPDNPVLCIHVSMHGAVLNSFALSKYGITEQTPTPEGGVILREEGTTEPAGLLMEMAWLPVMTQLPHPGLDELEKALFAYASYGITTAQEGFTDDGGWKLLQAGQAADRLPIDVVSLAGFPRIPGVFAETEFDSYTGRLKVGGVKIVADGSLQGLTACMCQPYLVPGPESEQPWSGEPGIPEVTVAQMVDAAYAHGVQVFIHCNGDRAIQMLIDAHKAAVSNGNHPVRPTVVVHSQTVSRAQLDDYVELGIVPSYFTNHTFFFGEDHITNLGEERASFISPMRTSLDLGLTCTNHTDFLVTPLNQMFTIWTAVNRTTRTGRVLGPDERVSPLEALEALTLSSAKFYGEEASKGSITVGKRADMAVLSDDLLTIDPDAIKDITVLRTFKDGATVFNRLT